jgi:hypothetical protein
MSVSPWRAGLGAPTRDQRRRLQYIIRCGSGGIGRGGTRSGGSGGCCGSGGGAG